MHPAHVAVLAIVMGFVSVDLFSRAWMGLMSLVASAVLAHRDELAGRELRSRLHTALAVMLLNAGLLAVLFHFYSRVHGLGTTTLECLLYLIAASVRMLVFLRGVSRRIDEMLTPGRDGR
ncbi:hypothetical protein GGQ74_002027 [Desulfobaculum xiamenense]|uniref:Uncharacterized protein n=1 Tax=Desulfobaculum xiamenense TaxID=995050 RepID=A0A846QT51_9BACT|nr:hypothetical protein [Desulfobaculum xiamenense]NJB68354.1 hypothetical protein [Desulfobaculum xiamenense]